MAVMYGHDVSPTNDHFALLAERAVDAAVKAMIPGAYAVNTFSFLRHVPTWFPGAGFQKYAQGVKKMTIEMKLVPFDFVRKRMVRHTVIQGWHALTTAFSNRLQQQGTRRWWQNFWRRTMRQVGQRSKRR